jgi:hypothetical protein
MEIGFDRVKVFVLTLIDFERTLENPFGGVEVGGGGGGGGVGVKGLWVR